ncbi:MAG: septal ring lytic transglycosylase RlpA family protein [Pseudomonadota bacterium]|nr:septal ring lytic transglycosylase RlpA family protein [Pseudomonadota bacterium]
MPKVLARIALFLVLLFPGACAELSFLSQATKSVGNTVVPSTADPQLPELGASYKVGQPYQIKNIWYYPKEDFSYVEEGIASWYGPGFHGKHTANGAIFDENRVSAAHRTLPLPSMVRITNLENGRSLKVIVNDRGPFAHSRIIDVSRRAAQLLGFEVKGTALVRVEVLEAESRKLSAAVSGGPAFVQVSKPEPPPPEPAPTGAVAGETLSAPPGTADSPVQQAELPREDVPIERPEAEADIDTDLKVVPVTPDPAVYIQAGAFGEFYNADRARASLSYLGPIIVEEITRSSTPLFRVRLGPLKDDERLESLLVAVIEAGYTDAQIVVNRN